MPYASVDDVPAQLSNLSLKQANYWSSIYDALVDKGMSKDRSAAIAWSVFKKKFKKVNDRWVRSGTLEETYQDVSVEYELLEYTRSEILSVSKSDTPKRYTKRTGYTDMVTVKRVGILELLSGSNDLDVYFKVHDYQVSVRIKNFKQYFNDRINDFEDDSQKFKAIRRIITEAVSRQDIEVKCTCPDFRYRFAYVATTLNYGMNTDETRPANQTNPNNKGRVCKHAISVLNRPTKWIPYVTTAISRLYKKNPEVFSV